MVNRIESDWNYAVTYLEFSFNNLLLATGSGFFWNNQLGETFLVSNWHNFLAVIRTMESPFLKVVAYPILYH